MDEVSLRMFSTFDLVTNDLLRNAAKKINEKEDRSSILAVLTDAFESFEKGCDYISMPYSFYKTLRLDEYGFPCWNPSDDYEEGKPWFEFMGESDDEMRKNYKVSDCLAWLNDPQINNRYELSTKNSI